MSEGFFRDSDNDEVLYRSATPETLHGLIQYFGALHAEGVGKLCTEVKLPVFTKGSCQLKEM